MFSLGVAELLIVLAIVVLIFGAKRLPQLGAGFGGMLHGFRKAVSGHEESPSRTSEGDRA